MLRSLKELLRYRVKAADGDIGGIVDFLLDDEHWTVRYLVVETPGFFNGRQILITPISFHHADWATKRFHLALTLAKIKNSPNVGVDHAVSRQHERDYYGYYGYPQYWGDLGVWGMGAYPRALASNRWFDVAGENYEKLGDFHLHSVKEVQGFHIQGSHDAIGHVEDCIVDDATWSVRYWVVDTSNWWLGREILIAPEWASRISWKERRFDVALSRQSIANSPDWAQTKTISRDYEARLHEHYGRCPAYWDDDLRRDRVLASPPG